MDDKCSWLGREVARGIESHWLIDSGLLGSKHIMQAILFTASHKAGGIGLSAWV